MRTNQLIKPNEKEEKVFSFTDFIDYSGFCPNLLIGKEIKAIKQSVAPLRNGPLGSQNAYCVNNRLFAYSSDKYIYEYKSYAFSKVDTSESLPILVPIIFEGQEEVLAINSTTSFVLGKSQNQFNVPKGSYWANYDNRLFIAENNVLYFSGPFDAKNLSMDLSNIGNISVSAQDGKIYGLANYQDDLIVVCQKSIYKLHISQGGEFSFGKLNIALPEVKAGSVVKVGSELLFVASKKLYAYKNGKVELLKPAFETYLSKTLKQALAYDEYYAITFVVAEMNYLYMYNTRTKQVHIIGESFGDYIGGKYFYDKSLNRIYQISVLKISPSEWTSLELDLGTHKNKMVTEVSVNMSTSGTCYVFGDTGSKWFGLRTGNNNKKLQLQGRKFSFSIMYNIKDVVIKDFKVKYKILED